MTDETVLAKGLVERIGIEGSVLTHQPGEGDKVKIEADIQNHGIAIKMVFDALTNKEHGVIENIQEIAAVGHRVAHGGEKLKQSVLVTPETLQLMEDCFEMAPLHNPPNVLGIKACAELMPGVPQVGVFDTAFHQTMPQKAYMYGLPYEVYEKYQIRRYGFHGTSHKYVAQCAADMMGKNLEDLKIVTCHLGNGSSIAAVKNGKCVDTSMGFTPLEGLVMGTRCGDVDPGALVYLMQQEGLDAEGISNLINKKSGVAGIMQGSSDMRSVEDGVHAGDERALLTLDMYEYRILKYIGAYAAVLGGVDIIVFTGGVGENQLITRENICRQLEYLGVTFDAEANNCRGKEVVISGADSKVKVVVIPTDEELMIAQDTAAIVAGK